MPTLSLVTAVAAIIMGGIFYTFSSFVMTALSNIKPAEGIRAMQRINIDVFCWSFSLLFFGLPIVSVALSIYAIWHWGQTESIYYLGGSVIYLVGCFLVTLAGNVPLNNKLAHIDPDSDVGFNTWQNYLSSWTRWNHVRTAACVIAGILFAGASFV